MWNKVVVVVVVATGFLRWHFVKKNYIYAIFETHRPGKASYFQAKLNLTLSSLAFAQTESNTSVFDHHKTSRTRLSLNF